MEVQNPFNGSHPSSPTESPIDQPQRPEPCAYPPWAAMREARMSVATTGQTTNYDDESKQKFSEADFAYQPHTNSSAPPSSHGSPDLEKAKLAKVSQQHSPTRSSDRDDRRRRSRHASSRNEKGDARGGSPKHNGHRSRHWDDDDDDDYFDEQPGRKMQEAKAVKILLFLSGPCVLLSLINLGWAFVALFITALTQPVRICARRPTVAQQIAGLLGPSLNLQLRSIYTPLPPHADEDASYNSGALLLEHLLSPFLSLCTMLAAWTVSIYWLTSAIVGDPAGQDKRDDGRECVLGLRSWWERWLMRSVNDD